MADVLLDVTENLMNGRMLDLRKWRLFGSISITYVWSKKRNGFSRDRRVRGSHTFWHFPILGWTGIIRRHNVFRIRPFVVFPS